MNYEISKVCTFQVENMQAFENLILWQNSIHLKYKKTVYYYALCNVLLCMGKGEWCKKEK